MIALVMDIRTRLTYTELVTSENRWKASDVQRGSNGANV